LWSPWLAPRQGRDDFHPDKEAILAAFQRKDGTHLAVLAVSGLDDVLTTLHHDGKGNITINSRNDAERDGVATLIVAVGKTVEYAIAAACYCARRMVTKYAESSGERSAELKAAEDGVKPEWLQDWFDGLAYCTWNGLGQQLHEQKIFDALESLQKNDINITTLIIDDNWVGILQTSLIGMLTQAAILEPRRWEPVCEWLDGIRSNKNRLPARSSGCRK
jgi:hypothetical protein